MQERTVDELLPPPGGTQKPILMKTVRDRTPKNHLSLQNWLPIKTDIWIIPTQWCRPLVKSDEGINRFLIGWT